MIFYVYLTRRSGRSHIEAAKRKAASDKPPQPGYKRRLIAYLVQMVLAGGAGMTVLSFLSLYMVDGLGASNAKATMLMSIQFLPAVIGATFLGGYLSDRLGSVKVIIATSLISGLVIFGIKSFPLGLGFYAMLLIMGTNMAIRMPVTEVFIMSQAPANTGPRSTACTTSPCSIRARSLRPSWGASSNGTASDHVYFLGHCSDRDIPRHIGPYLGWEGLAPSRACNIG